MGVKKAILEKWAVANTGEALPLIEQHSFTLVYSFFISNRKSISCNLFKNFSSMVRL